MGNRRPGGEGIVSLATAFLATIAILLSLTAPALAATNNGGNTAYVTATDDSNIFNQTIVGEGQNNNVIITNTSDDNSVSLTGVVMANMPAIVIGVIVIAGATVIVMNTRKKASDDDE